MFWIFLFDEIDRIEENSKLKRKKREAEAAAAAEEAANREAEVKQPDIPKGVVERPNSMKCVREIRDGADVFVCSSVVNPMPKPHYQYPLVTVFGLIGILVLMGICISIVNCTDILWHIENGMNSFLNNLFKKGGKK